MYRIELSSGEETVFRSIEELAVAIKRGVVTPRARIYHNASSKWLPIQFHPHYKVAVSMPLTQAALVAGPPVKQLETLSLDKPQDSEPPLRFMPPLPEPSAPSLQAPPPEVERPSRKKRARAEPPASEKKQPRRRTKSQRQLRIALVGALLIGGAQWVLSAPLFSRSDVPAIVRTQRHLIAAQTEAMKRVSSANTAAMIPVLPTPASTTPPSFGGTGGVQPAAPGLQPPATAAAQLPTTTSESAATPAIEPAPSTIDVSAPTAKLPDSLASQIVDSANKKAIKGILRAVSGTPAKEKTAAKR
jgi:hypothetical protein